jgi:hypothetical protein
MIPAFILTVFIILIEAILLRRWQKNIPFKTHLKYSTFNNIVSSLIGSVILVVFVFKQPFWEIMILYPAMFILTIIVETQLIKYEYRQKFTTWFDAIKKSVYIHFYSYIFVFLLQPVFFILFAFYLNFLHTQNIKNWNDFSITKDETGYIYTVEGDDEANSSTSKNALFQYDVKTKVRKKIDLGLENKEIDSISWDIKGNKIAYIGNRYFYNNEMFVSILDINTLTLVSKIHMQKYFRNFSISPDETMLAALEYYKDVKGPKYQDGYFMLGTSCKLKVYELSSGKLLYQAPLLALEGGLTWTNDSKNIIFASLQDHNLLTNTKQDHLTRGYGRAYAREGQFPMVLYNWNLQTNKISFLTEGENPVSIINTNDILFVNKSKIWRINLDKKNPYVFLEKLKLSHSYAVSPTGKSVITLIPHKTFLSHSNYLTIVKPNNLQNKLIIDENYNGKVIWTNSRKETNIKNITSHINFTRSISNIKI